MQSLLSRYKIAFTADVRSLGALRQPRDDNAGVR